MNWTLFIFAVALTQAALVIVTAADGAWFGWIAGSIVAVLGIALADGHGYVFGYAAGLEDKHEISEIMEEDKNGR